ncbi:MAG: Holliday junction branch migration protein RuvA, partial [Paludibacteraceae bacterium]|nr:Holliday junction branch migration protein RuvA [Paludibacteraceae bacterium]
MTKGERELFEALTSVSGIGPNTGRMIMSGYTAVEIRQIIATGNVKAMSSIKGIGPKTAQLIIVTLKDKVLKIDLGDNPGSMNLGPEAVAGQAAGINSEVKAEAVSALTMLGFPAVAAGKAVDKLLKADPTLRVEKVIKEALKML